MGIIQAICISEVRGVQKHAIPEADLTPEWGIGSPPPRQWA